MRAMLVLLAAAAAGALKRQGIDYRLVGDVQVEYGRPRSYGALGAAAFTDSSRLWPEGKVNYYIDTSATNQDNPSDARLSAADVRIAAAISDVGMKTCVTFSACTDLSGCAKPYLHFVSDKDACNSPLGLASDRVNQINVARTCSTAAVARTILHSLGFADEHLRNDRDSHVYVDLSKAASAEAFTKITVGRDIGPYDYDSVLHVPSAYGASTGHARTILAPTPFGHGTTLSAWDVKTVNFMYNNCSSSYTAPSCVASRDEAVSHVIPKGKAFDVEFNALYSTSLTVSSDQTTAPEGTWATNNEGGRVRGTFTPNAAGTYKLAATFTGTDNVASTCSVDVTVVDDSDVCYGLGASDVLVCSGRGACGSDPAAPCTCDSTAGGLDCSGSATCPTNYLLSMDKDALPWRLTGAGAIETAFFALGGGALVVGDEAAPTAGGASAGFTLETASQAARVTYFLAAMPGSSPTVQFLNSESAVCFDQLLSDGFTFSSRKAAGLSSQSKTYYMIDLHIDWAAGTYDAFVDGRLAIGEVAINAACTGSGAAAAIASVNVEGNGWVDEFHVWCAGYVVASGTAAEFLTQDALRAGGSTLTLSLVGGTDTWVNSNEVKQALVSAVESVYPGEGFNSHKGSLLNTGMVTISASTVTIGPFAAKGDYPNVAVREYIAVRLAESMFASRVVPRGMGLHELQLQIPGSCPGSKSFAFDAFDAEVAEASHLEIDTGDKHEGAGSLKITAVDVKTTLSVKRASSALGLRPAAVRYHTKMASNDAQLTLEFVSTGSAASKSLKITHGSGSFHAYTTADGGEEVRTSTAVRAGEWEAVELQFDWVGGSFTLVVGGAEAATGVKLPEGMVDVATLDVWVASSPAHLDALTAACDEVLPTFSLGGGLSCIDPTATSLAAEFHFFPGTSPLGIDDVMGVIPGTNDASCSELKCDEGGCSSSLGIMTGELGRVTWNAGPLPNLIAGITYKMCYKLAGAADFALLTTSFRTCGATPFGMTNIPSGVDLPGLLASFAPSLGLGDLVVPPLGNQTSTPLYATNCSAYMISKQGKCIRKRSEAACDALGECSWCRIGTHTHACLYTREACGLFAVGIAELNYEGVKEGTNDSCPTPTGVFWSMADSAATAGPSLFATIAALLFSAAAHAVLP
eukprot:TRINITY_DN11054_c0_g5_i1.p1 TRINITY_DN11054_c0_g5~~TRINITY_DN11054_c0_g5_i1.p1  ORF type:complete len:1146 (+),score=280.03 TRINITY_DN11054_c0_g5_i1:60-3497(+)